MPVDQDLLDRARSDAEEALAAVDVTIVEAHDAVQAAELVSVFDRIWTSPSPGLATLGRLTSCDKPGRPAPGRGVAGSKCGQEGWACLNLLRR